MDAEDYLHLFIKQAKDNPKEVSTLDGLLVYVYKFRKGDIHYEMEIDEDNNTRIVSGNELIVEWQESPEKAYHCLLEFLTNRTTEYKGILSYLLSLLKPKSEKIEQEF